MKFTTRFATLILSGFFFIGCNQKEAKPKAETVLPQTDAKLEKAKDCDIKIAGIPFTKALNGAENLLQIANDEVNFSVGEKKDYFNDPNGTITNSAPILLTRIDNRKPFTFVSKVTPEFTTTATYNAGVMYVYSDDNLYQKLCFEQDERGNHRVVTVRTKGTSDDNNHDIVTQPFVYMKISSDTKSIGSYYSLDNKTWHLARLYKNEYPETLWLGISAQCPMDKGSTSKFENLELTQKSVANFRLGI